MLDHILVLLDESPYGEYALAHTAAIARPLRSQVTLMHLMPAVAHQSFVDPLDWHAYKSEAEASLNVQVSRLQEANLEVQSELLETPTFDHIMDYAAEQHVDLIVVASQEDVLREISGQVMKHSDIPVLIARSDGITQDDVLSARYHKILVPLDGSQRAESVLPLAGMLARASEAQLLLAHVVHKPELSRQALPSSEDVELANRLVERNQEEGIKYLENIAGRLGEDVQYRVLVSDNVAIALHDLIEQEAVDLVILSAHGYSAVPRWSHGSIANTFVAFGSHPVLVVQDLPSNHEPSPNAGAPVRQIRGR
jgi:nucleotide-binding universal stress UspA family protein